MFKEKCRVLQLSLIILSLLLFNIRLLAGAPAETIRSSATGESRSALPAFSIRNQNQSRETELRARSSIRRSNIDARLRWNRELDLPGYLVSLGRTLTSPSAEDPAEIARKFVLSNRQIYSTKAASLAEARVCARDVDASGAFTRVGLEQRVNGIPVFDSQMIFIVDSAGRLLSVSGSFIPGIESRVRESEFLLAADAAFSKAAGYCGAALNNDISIRSEEGAAGKQFVLESEELKQASLAGMVYYPVSRDIVRPAWQIYFSGTWEAFNSCLVVVDAEDGQLLFRRPLTFSANPPRGRVFTKENPIVSGDRELVDFRGDATASPSGWVASDRLDGNNAQIFFNPKAKRVEKNAMMIQSNRDGNFDFPLDFNRDPLDNYQASGTSLFYWLNYAHDVFYGLGFTERWRNFQVENYGRGGQGGDPIKGLNMFAARISQPRPYTPLIRNNAYFSFAPEGQQSSVTMLMWDIYPTESGFMRDSDFDAGVILHEYTHGVTLRMSGTDTMPGLQSMQGSGLGEGYSDFFSLSFLAGSDLSYDFPTRGGAYLIPGGSRSYPYCTNMDVNPLTFSSFAENTESHAMGTVWATILWDLRQNLVARYGFEQGRHMAEQLILIGVKLLPMSPALLDARDGILLADRTRNGGANQELIWKTFARRGMGQSAFEEVNYYIVGSPLKTMPGYDLPADYTAGGIWANDSAPLIAVEGEPLPISVSDRDLKSDHSVDVRITNLRTEKGATLILPAAAPGCFRGSLVIGTGAGTSGIAAEPGDEISIKYHNRANQSGTGEDLEVKATAARRVVLIDDDFESGADLWSFESMSTSMNGTNYSIQNCWHWSGKRASGGTHSVYCGREEGAGASGPYLPALSGGLMVTKALDMSGMLRPHIEFDYFFKGKGSDPNSSDYPDSASFGFLTRIVSEGQEDQYGWAGIDLPQRYPLFAHVEFSSGAVTGPMPDGTLLWGQFPVAAYPGGHRKTCEGVYIDNVKITAIRIR